MSRPRPEERVCPPGWTSTSRKTSESNRSGRAKASTFRRVFELEYPGYALIMFNKSGIAARYQLQVGACVVDEDYQGEIHLHVMNVGKDPVILKPGMKLVQGLVMPVFYVGVEVLESEAELFPQSTERGVGGFGSTGE